MNFIPSVVGFSCDLLIAETEAHHELPIGALLKAEENEVCRGTGDIHYQRASLESIFAKTTQMHSHRQSFGMQYVTIQKSHLYSGSSRDERII